MIAIRKSSFAIALAIALSASAVSAQQIDKIGIYDLAKERLTGSDTIRVKNAEGFASLRVVFTVDTDGRVIEAKVDDNEDKLDPKPALAAVRNWTFAPQNFEGRPVQAVSSAQVNYNRMTIKPDAARPFPKGPLQDVEITLERGNCFGTCPAYTITIKGDGTVRYFAPRPPWVEDDAFPTIGIGGVNVISWGPHERKIDPKAVEALLEKFRQAHFFGMREKYVAKITDSPSYALTLKIGENSKTVLNYVGSLVGMPASITALEDAVDDLAGSARWLRGNRDTVPSLKAEGFDFSSSEAAYLVASAIQLSGWGDEPENVIEMILAAINEGLNLKQEIELGRQKEKVAVGTLITKFAMENGNVELFGLMAKRGFIAMMSKDELSQAFTTAMGCNPAMARALVAVGADPNFVGSSGNALHAATSSYGRCGDAPDHVQSEMIKALVDIGVPVEARNEYGWTPLMRATKPEIAKTLIDAGADVNAKEDGGGTPLTFAYDDRAALLLLKAGADPNVKVRGETFRQLAKERRMPASLAWLDAQGVK